MGFISDLRKQRDAQKTLRWATEMGENVSSELVRAARATPLRVMRDRREAQKTLAWASEVGEDVSLELLRAARRPTPLQDLQKHRREAQLRRDFWWVD